jgi:hypothetical protein
MLINVTFGQSFARDQPVAAKFKEPGCGNGRNFA